MEEKDFVIEAKNVESKDKKTHAAVIKEKISKDNIKAYPKEAADKLNELVKKANVGGKVTLGKEKAQDLFAKMFKK